jgi:hypothetical protein
VAIAPLGAIMLSIHPTCEATVPILIGVIVDEAIRTGDVRAVAT